MKVAVIGAGAAGFFTAICIRARFPAADIRILEKTQKVLSKVKVSGGGRCNVTNGEVDVELLSKAYPRGARFMKRALHHFSTQHIQSWFKERDIELYEQDDGRIFPESNKSQTIIDCFLSEVERLDIKVELGCQVVSICRDEENYRLAFKNDNRAPGIFNKVVVTTGGSPKVSGFDWLKELGHRIEPPVPSLFTFNMPDEDVRQLMGVALEECTVSIQGSKLAASGPLLITHWGMSGPAILKLSAFGARELAEREYEFFVRVKWISKLNDDEIRQVLTECFARHSNQKIGPLNPLKLPKRLWHFLLAKSNVDADKSCSEIGKKLVNQLVQRLTNDTYSVRGKTTFKEEFVTCGGISLKSIDWNTMQSKSCPGLYFAGEVLDIDGITGGYNFQAAWTTAFLASHLSE